jgi:type I restriction enzyme S subunit
MEKQKKIPKLRFPEFKEEWERRKVGALCDSIVPGRNKPTDFKGDIPWITTPDIEHNGIITLSKKGLNISKEQARKIGSKIVPKNSIIISCVGDLGLAAITGKEIVINQQLHAFLPKENIEYRFLLYQLNLQKKYMNTVATKTAVPYMNKDNCNSIPITFPSLPEQTRIASFFTVIDKKICELKQKKALLEQYKKGVMQKLFSQELRFKDENGKDYPDWKKKKLGEIGETYSGLSGKSKENFGLGKPYIQYKQIFDDSKIDISRFELVDIGENEKQNKVKFGDVFFTVSSETPNEIGMSSVLLDDIEELYLNSFCFGYRANSLKELSPYFSQYLFRCENFRIEIIKLAQGSTRYNMSKLQLLKIEIQLPSLPEQTKIANFLSAIDNKINRTQKQIEQAEIWKKGLLQQMFC